MYLKKSIFQKSDNVLYNNIFGNVDGWCVKVYIYIC